MKSKAREYYELLARNMRGASIIFCAIISVAGLWTFLLTRSLPALFISLAFLLFAVAHADEYYDVNKKFAGRSFAVRVLAYFLMLTALAACFRL